MLAGSRGGCRRRRPAKMNKKPHPREEGWESAVSSYAELQHHTLERGVGMDNEIGGRRRRPAGIKKKTPPPREEGWEWAVSSYACRI